MTRLDLAVWCGKCLYGEI